MLVKAILREAKEVEQEATTQHQHQSHSFVIHSKDNKEAESHYHSSLPSSIRFSSIVYTLLHLLFHLAMEEHLPSPSKFPERLVIVAGTYDGVIAG